MEHLDLEKTLRWNGLGIIQGPIESDAEFKKRACHLEEFKKEMVTSLDISEQETKKTDALLEDSFKKTRALYDIEPKFVPIFFSNEKLPFWHGGASWIVQLTKDSPISAFIQLRKGYYNRKKVLFYDREEILVHELAHVGRMSYDCSSFEEIIAWSSSSNRFRRFFGPLFTSLKETSLFAFLLVTLFLMDVLCLFLGNESLFKPLQSLKLIPLAYFGYMLIRLYFRQKAFSKCHQKLKKLLTNPTKAQAVLYRLSDHEIFFFAKEPQEAIKTYIQKQSDLSMRWKTLNKAYPWNF